MHIQPHTALGTQPSVGTAVVGSVDLGEVMCDSLVVAEDAVSLSFVIHEETLVAERSSYTFTPGGIFEDGLDRHVCHNGGGICERGCGHTCGYGVFLSQQGSRSVWYISRIA